MTGNRSAPRPAKARRRDVFSDGERELGERELGERELGEHELGGSEGEFSEGEFDKLEELDAVALDEVPAWRIDRALRATRRPRD